MSNNKHQHFSDIFQKYLNNECSPEEIDELFEILSVNDDPELNKLIGTVLESNGGGRGISNEKLKRRLDGGLDQIMNKIEERQKPVLKIFSLKVFSAAAAVALIFIIGSKFFYQSKPTGKKEIALQEKKGNDVPAPIGKALLKLGDGTIVYLDSIHTGELAVQGSVKVIKTASGEITYKGANTDVMHNTLINPRGSKVVRVTLEDGTSVWLNAESSISYPTAFKGKERSVEITGEAYFEVAHNKAMPFIVSKGQTKVKVLGTHFNVNSYDNETFLKVTLMEGAVRVSANASQTKTLKPGQQAQVDKNDITVRNDIDTDDVMAWKNGKFQFNSTADIGSIMRQISRWYDVDVEFTGTVNQHFWGSITRDANVSEVLKKIESTGGVRFKIDGRKIVVMP